MRGVKYLRPPNMLGYCLVVGGVIFAEKFFSDDGTFTLKIEVTCFRAYGIQTYLTNVNLCCSQQVQPAKEYQPPEDWQGLIVMTRLLVLASPLEVLRHTGKTLSTLGGREL